MALIPDAEAFPDLTRARMRSNIAAFRPEELAGLSDRGVLARMLRVIAPDTGQCTIPGLRSGYPKDTRFYRVLPVPKGETALPLSVLTHADDCWIPPSASGPFNRAGEPVLPTAPGDPDTAVGEADLSRADHFCLVSFSAMQDISCALIAPDPVLGESAVQDGDKIALFYRFVQDVFAACAKDPALHDPCRAIARAWFLHPDHHGWATASTRRAHKACVTFYPDAARACLSLEGAMVCATHAYQAGHGGVKCAVGFDPDTGQAQYHAVGSAAQQALFPHLTAQA